MHLVNSQNDFHTIYTNTFPVFTPKYWVGKLGAREVLYY